VSSSLSMRVRVLFLTRRASSKPTSAPNPPQSTSPAATFISKMIKTLGGGGFRLPQVPKRRVKSLPLGTTPRRSRRIAGFGAEQQQHSIPGCSRSKKTHEISWGCIRGRFLYCRGLGQVCRGFLQPPVRNTDQCAGGPPRIPIIAL
jgi:hypothetical protein